LKPISINKFHRTPSILQIEKIVNDAIDELPVEDAVLFIDDLFNSHAYDILMEFSTHNYVTVPYLIEIGYGRNTAYFGIECLLEKGLIEVAGSYLQGEKGNRTLFYCLKEKSLLNKINLEPSILNELIKSYAFTILVEFHKRGELGIPNLRNIGLTDCSIERSIKKLLELDLIEQSGYGEKKSKNSSRIYKYKKYKIKDNLTKNFNHNILYQYEEERL